MCIFEMCCAKVKVVYSSCICSWYQTRLWGQFFADIIYHTSGIGVRKVDRWIRRYSGVPLGTKVSGGSTCTVQGKNSTMTRQVKTVTLCVTKLPTIEHEKNRKCGGLSFDSQFYTTDSTAFVVDDCIFTALTCIDCIDCGVDITAACSSYYIK